MFLHLGADVVINKKYIVAIMDLETTSVSKITKDYLKKATKETCYIKKQGTFLPLPLSVAPATLSLFQRGLKEKRLFLLFEKDASYIEEHILELYEKYWHEFF